MFRYRPESVSDFLASLPTGKKIFDGAIEVHKGKREGSRRRIEMTPRLNAILEMLGPMSRDGWVFPADTKSGHIETCSYEKQHASALKKSAVSSFVVHALRHTCLTRWAKAGMDPFTLMYLAGHKSLATTTRYIHLAGTDAQIKLHQMRQKGILLPRSHVGTISGTTLILYSWGRGS